MKSIFRIYYKYISLIIPFLLFLLTACQTTGKTADTVASQQRHTTETASQNNTETSQPTEVLPDSTIIKEIDAENKDAETEPVKIQEPPVEQNKNITDAVQPEAIPQSEAVIIENIPTKTQSDTTDISQPVQDLTPIPTTEFPEAIQEGSKTEPIPETTSGSETPSPTQTMSTRQDTEKQPLPVQSTAETQSTNKDANSTTENATENKIPEVQQGTQSSVGAEESKNNATPVPSRNVTIKRNQYLDVAYPGSGWTYIGETGNTHLMAYFGRKLDSKNTSFTLRSRAAGDTILHFYKTDILKGVYIDDYLAVKIEDESSTSGDHVTAPSYAEIVPPKSPLSTDVQTDNTQTTPSTAETTSAQQTAADISVKNQDTTIAQAASTSVVPQTATSSSALPDENNTTTSAENVSVSDNLLNKAEAALAAKKYSTALALLHSFFDNAVTRIDEALFIQGQVLEAKSDVQDIHGAIESYDEIVHNWPSSSYWNQAKQRSTYLKRFYIDIR